MKTEVTHLEFPEPERYEMREGPRYHFEMSRRQFGQVLGAGLLISMVVPPSLAQRSGGSPATPLSERLHIRKDGLITVLTSKVEVGQGSRTQLTQAAAEELQVPVEQIRLIMADSALVPDDGGTAGSRTTPSTVPAIRKACAAARKLLLETAAQLHQAELSSLSVREGRVSGLPAGQEFDYAQLARNEEGAALQRRVDDSVELIEVSDWRVLGTSVERVDGSEIVTGAHQYPSDIRRPGLLYGKVLRPPSYGAQLSSIDLKAAQAMPGMMAVQDGDFVGFAAPTSFAAEEALAAAEKTAVWKSADHPSSEALYQHLRTHASDQRSRRDARGAPEKVFETAAQVRRETYHIAYVQHAPMETRAAVAEWVDGRLTVWTGTQQPSRVRQELARSFSIPQEHVRVMVPDTGGGFGGKHTGEVAVEAARLALAARKPVLVHWSREEEFTWAYFRPAGVIDVAGALDADGHLVGWEHVNFNSGASAIATPYAIPNTVTEFKYCQSPLREGSYRALASAANAFARESFIDELAALRGEDPLEFRYRHLTHDRLRAVLAAAAEKFDWKSKWRKHSGKQRSGVGLACGTEKGSYTACCVEIAVDEERGTYRVVQVCQSFECGAIQNPANLQAQVEGCLLQGLGGALSEEMRFREGKILNARFSGYRVPRFKDVPAMEIVLVNRPDLPSVGGGETPIIAIAPAIANALFYAAGERIRSLPIRNQRFRAAG